eukprot:5554717-Amphidinium_carterae.1
MERGRTVLRQELSAQAQVQQRLESDVAQAQQRQQQQQQHYEQLTGSLRTQLESLQRELQDTRFPFHEAEARVAPQTDEYRSVLINAEKQRLETELNEEREDRVRELNVEGSFKKIPRRSRWLAAVLQ